ncbi:putative aminoadipate reductase [Heliocybe sulcata]|uniref:Putative aminoadipate reductase n=1 Tax=Heliocybe sulcata TaxID=5364 RepID=A0A5C3MZ66_9AGAM|nr:putative aminoadipate reductase [Heliocybe sulcata]
MAQNNWTLLPTDGTVSFAELVDIRLEKNPESVYSIVAPDDPGRDATRISMLEWCRAIHRLAYALRPQPDFQSREVVALILNCDTIMYATAVMAVMRAGFVAYPMSNRNSPAAICHMLQATGCHRIIVSSDTLSGLVSGISAHASALDYDIHVSALPSLRTAFPHFGQETLQDKFVPYPTLENCGPDDVITFIHSSGSTGFPKSIPHTNRSIMGWYAGPWGADIAQYPKHLTFGSMALPTFHGLGLGFQVWAPLIVGSTATMFPPKEPAFPVIPTPENSIEAMKRTGVNAVMVVPAFLEALAESEDAVRFLSTMEVVLTGGGPMSVEIGDQLVAAGVKLRTIYGGTEFGGPTYAIPPEGLVDPKDWNYLRFHPVISYRLVPQDDNTTYELQVLHTDRYPLNIHNIPDVPGYATLDLFEKHPTKEGLWKIVGRVDDVITLASGEKTVPIPMEGKIVSSPLVAGAMMLGRGRSQPGLLVQPSTDHSVNPEDGQAVAEFKNMIWPVIEEANKDAPAFSRIFKEMILVCSPEKPLRRTPKGTVQRKPTLADYAKEIDELYDAVKSSNEADVEGPKSFELHDLGPWLLEQAVSVHRAEDAKLDPDVDLFAQGFDSLSATFLRNHIISVLRSSDDHATRAAASSIPQNFIFSNNTIKSLANAVRVIIFGPGAGGERESHAAAMKRLIAKYSEGMAKVGNAGQLPLPPKAVVLVTGTTGGLGSYLLWMLLVDTKVERVYALNRKSDRSTLAHRQRDAFADRGLPFDVLSSEKLVLVEGDEAGDKLGLAEALYEEIMSTCTRIIHNSWRLDFNLSVSSFEPNIRGTRNLIQLALASPLGTNMRFIFTSSISVTQSWGRDAGPFPEAVDLPVEVAVGGGYGEAKYICEKLLVKANELGIETSSLRIGQIAGGKPDGAWATTDWVPIFVKSSRVLGCLPDAQGVATWMPTEVVAGAVLDTAFAAERPPLSLNIVHPKALPWTNIVKQLGDSVAKIIDGPESKPLPLLPLKDWVALLEKQARNASESDIAAIPAIKLLEFFQVLASNDEQIAAAGIKDAEFGGVGPSMVTEKAQFVSRTLREAAPLRAEDVERWIKYWNKKGLFTQH